MSMRQDCIDAIEQLNNCSSDYGKIYVDLRMHFARKYQRGLTTSTLLGAEFFAVLLSCIAGAEHSKKDYRGELEDNFRKLIENGRKQL